MRITITAVILVLLGLAIFIWVNRAYDSFFNAAMIGDSGSVQSAENWPRPVDEIFDRATDHEVAIRNLNVFCLADGLVSEYVWRIDATHGLLELMQNEYELIAQDLPEGRIAQLREGSPPWWAPLDDTHTVFFKGRSSNLGGKGDQFDVFYDRSKEVIFVYYNDNW